MSDALRTRAELEKLGRLLELDGATLAPLGDVAPQDVRALRHQIADALFDTHRRHFERVAGAAKILPGGLAAALAQRALGPLLAARAAGLLEPESAASLACRLPPSFLADIAIELDPRHATAVISGVPADQIAAAAAELERRGELGAMAGFVGHISPEALAAVLDVLSDSALLRVGFLLEEPGRLDAIVAALPAERLRSMGELAVREARAEEILGIFSALKKRQRARVAKAAVAVDARASLEAAAAVDPGLRECAEELLALMPAG